MINTENMKRRVYLSTALLFACVLTLTILNKNNKVTSIIANFQNKQEHGDKSIKTNNVNFQHLNDSLNSNCVMKNVTLSKTALPLTGLVSFPGSGNTWTRHLIQQMTGLATSSVFCDQTLRKNGFPYECSKEKRNQTIVIKTHLVKDIAKFSKIVFLIRNPYDAFITYANFKLAGHTNTPTKEKLMKKFGSMLGGHIKFYKSLVNETVENFNGTVHVLQYERLKTDMAKELKKLALFLNVNIKDRDIACTVKLQEGNFHRNSTNDEYIAMFKSVYNKSSLLMVQQTARFVEKQLNDAFGVNVDLSASVEWQFS